MGVKPITLALCILLAGCAGSLQDKIDADIAKIANFSIADLEAADKDAIAHNDELSHACYPALERFVKELQGDNPNATVKGAFSAFQKARDVRHGVENGLPNYLKLGCAPLVQDETLLLAKLGVIGAGAAIVGPIAPALIP